MFREYKPSRALRSKDSGQLVQSRVQTKQGEAAFSCYAANKWNKLPVEIKLSPNFYIQVKNIYFLMCLSMKSARYLLIYPDCCLFLIISII